MKLYDFDDISPSLTIIENMEYFGITREKLSSDTGIDLNIINNILDVKIPLSFKNAYKIGEVIHIDGKFLIQMEIRHQLTILNNEFEQFKMRKSSSTTAAHNEGGARNGGGMTMDIVGYEQDGRCDHCGRALRYVILFDDGRKVGAMCLAKVMTKPRETYGGKKYRLSPSTVIHLAKCAEFWSSDKRYLMGITDESLHFEPID